VWQYIGIMSWRLVVDIRVLLRYLHLSFGNVPSQFWRRCGTAIAVFTVEKLNQLINAISGHQMLREQVGWVHQPVDFPKFDRAGLHAFLHPQRVGLYVPQLTQS
jgi:hypothetical protein